MFSTLRIIVALAMVLNLAAAFPSSVATTGCRADLHSVASAYKLNTVAEGCRIQFFDNTMCDTNELSDIAGQITPTDTCRVADFRRRFGSYQVSCE
ncbi:hypothetical protein N7541_002028 [Penicillium brevicompactum]|uniref:Uncharacterized protein n=1 Tax=Penicillium brevicompactum TaxID=5074 RepID=A0A9W9RKY6_PENBR|nr:hypothetical protein N7541_002028 [Penicillium brevicompactum]